MLQTSFSYATIYIYIYNLCFVWLGDEKVKEQKIVEIEKGQEG